MSQPRDPTWQRWEEVDPLFAQALEKEPEARDRFLAAACGADVELRRAVGALLAVAEAAGETLHGPGAAILRRALFPEVEEMLRKDVLPPPEDPPDASA